MSFNVTEIVYDFKKENEEFLFYLESFLEILGIEVYKNLNEIKKQEGISVRFAINGDLIKNNKFFCFQIGNNQKKNIEGLIEISKKQGYLSDAELQEINRILDLYFEKKYYNIVFFLNHFYFLPENDKIVEQAKNFANSISNILFNENNSKWEDESLIRTKYAFLKVISDINSHEKKGALIYNGKEILEVCRIIIFNKANERKIPAIFHLMANVYNAIDDPNEAYQYLTKYAEAGFPNSIIVFRGKGRYWHYESEIYDKAIPFYEKTISICNVDFISRLNLARCYGNIGKLEQAIEVFKENERMLIQKLSLGCITPIEFHILIHNELRLTIYLQSKKKYGHSRDTVEKARKCLENLDKILFLSEIEPERNRLTKVLMKHIPLENLIDLANIVIMITGGTKSELWDEKSFK